jgi:hypothetical protein
MNGKFVLGIINYFILSLTLIFGIISVILVDQRKKLTFLFLMYLFAGITSFLFFAGPTFAIVGIVILFFFLLLFSFIFHQEFFGFGKTYLYEKIHKRYFAAIQPNIIANMILSILSCLFIGYLFYSYTQSFYKQLTMVKTFSTPSLAGILNDIGSNYVPIILIIVCMLASSFIWFIGILPNRRGKN